jgi:UDP-N-acetylmuramyl pentapeptide phosphotransferase/UDP-N-acetylglucosamine-1-phosphate transferase
MTTTFAASLMGLAGAVLTWLLLMIALKSGLAWRIAVDLPNDRSLHDRAVPRIGGLAVIGVLTVGILLVTPSLRPIAAIAAVLMAISAIDDRHGLPIPARLAVHVAAATLAAYAIAPQQQGWLLVALVAILVWSMNLYNFMDGADGLAGGMTVFGFGAYAVASIQWESRDLALVSACAAGAGAGFLMHNFPPARLFLGDAGSVPLGFLAAALGVVGWSGGQWPAAFPLLAFAPFVLDATLTLVLRALRGQRVWEAHRTHLYQRMVREGFGHRGTALAWYGAMAIAAATAVAAIRWPIGWQIGLLAAWVALYASVATGLLRLPHSARR